MLEILALLVPVLVLAFIFRDIFYRFFFVVLLTTEFFYIHIGGGIARGYQFYALLVVFLLAKEIPKLLESRVLWALLIFVGINICAIIYSDSPGRAFFSFLAVTANISVAMATAMILLTGKVKLATLLQIILLVTLVSIFWGLLQIVAYRFAGFNLSLSEEQVNQIAMGFGPGFRSEANTFGKYMVFPFLLFLPEYIEHKRIKNINWIYLVFLVGILMNFTRTSIYGMGIAFLFVFFWYVRVGKLSLLSQKSVKLAVVIGLAVVLMKSGALNVSDYAMHKINNIFNQEEILQGSSSGYRLDMMRFIVGDALSDSKKMVVGNGWGQTYFRYYRQEVRAGGGDIVSVLGYAGLLGVGGYLLYMLSAFGIAWKTSSRRLNLSLCSFSEGMMFAFVGIFCVGQMAGYLIMPEYWLMIGMAIYLSLNKCRKKTATVSAEVG